MPTAYYFDFKLGHHGAPNRVGGQPSHVPINKPWPASEDDYWGFIMQLVVDGTRLRVSDAAYLHLYQPIDDGDDPTPYVVIVPPDAPPNSSGSVVESPFVECWDVDFVKREDPPAMPTAINLESANLMKSKLGGLDPWGGSEELLLQLAVGVVGFNFGGTMCSVYRDENGDLSVRMN